MTLTKDSNNDKDFGETDEVTTFEINIDTESAPREIFAPGFKNNLKILFDKQWKPVNE